MNKGKLIEIIESFCPSNIAEEWDNCGFQVNCEKDEVHRVLVSLDITKEVVDEAIEQNSDMVLTHHPMLFTGVKSIDCNTVTGNHIFRLIKHNISVYSCHTSFDKVTGGNNDYFGELLELNNIRPFDRDNGFCRKGDTPFETTFLELTNRAAQNFGIDKRHFRCVGDMSSVIETVGWCTGAGGDFIESAYNEGCDLYITGDLKHNQAVEAKALGMCVLDAGHYGSEKIFAENIADMLRKKTVGDDIEITESMKESNPYE